MIISAYSWKLLALVTLVTVICAGVASAETVQVRFFSQGELISVECPVPNGMAAPEAAVRALVKGPTKAQMAIGITSAIPAGVTISSLVIDSDSVKVDLSAEVIEGLNEANLLAIFDQFRSTLGDFSSILQIKLTSSDKTLASYLPPVGPVPSLPRMAAQEPVVNGVGLAGKKIGVGPSHGKYWNSTYGWLWQRGLTCGWGEAALEDVLSTKLVAFLQQYLTQDGATFVSPRQMDESDCCHSETGLAWSKMCAQTWLHHIGAPGSVWAAYSGNTGADNAVDRSSDDVRARPLWADYNNTDIYIACHTNAGGEGKATGTETFRDTLMEHPEHVAGSLNLATQVQASVVDAIRTTFDEEPNWANRGVKDSAAGFGEIRVPSRPAILIELAFHDDCTRDALYLTQDDFFKSVAEWGLYKGVCAYFGNTPTWDKYSCEYVSDTIPTIMTPGQVYNCSITLQNRGVCWYNGRGFKLVATSNNDSWFKSVSNVTVVDGTKPGDTCTFNFQLTGPIVGGTRTTEWRMVRDGYSSGFGPTVTKIVDAGTVVDNDPPTVPQNLRMTSNTITSISLAWDASTDTGTEVEGYTLYRDGVAIGTFNGDTTSYTNTGLTMNKSYTYEVDAFDAFNNRSTKSDVLVVSTMNDADPPTVPQNLQSTSKTTSSISLAWDASTDSVTSVGGYTVYRNGTPVGTVTGTTFTDTGLTQNVSYIYEIDAFDIVNNRSAKSNPLSVTTHADAEAPTVPGDLHITSVGTTSISLAWTASTDNVGVIGYGIYSNGSLIATTASTSYTNAVASGYRGIYEVDAYDEAGNRSTKSNSVSQTSYIAYGPFNSSMVKCIRDTSPDANSSDLRLPTYNNNSQKGRVVCNFPMTTAPAQSLVNMVRFRLWQDCGAGMYSNNSYTCTVQVHPLLQSVTSGVTWNTRNGTTAWTTAGGTYGAQVGGNSVWRGNCGNWFEFDWTSPLPTYGMIARGVEEGSATCLYSRKPVGNGTQGGAPTLQIDYIAPSGEANSVIQNWNAIGTWADADTSLATDFLAQNNSGVVPVSEATVAARTGASYNSQTFAATSQNNDVFDAIAYGWALNCSGYASAYVYYDHADNANVYVATGSDDRFKLWINGSQVASYLNASGRGCSVDNDFNGPVTLKQGWNRILMKVQNGVGGYGWCLRFANIDRTALGNCTYALTDSTAPTKPTTCTEVGGAPNNAWQNTVSAPNFAWTGADDPQGIGEGVSGIRGYKVYFGTDPAGIPDTFQSTATLAPGAVADGVYYLRVAAVDYALNESAASTLFTLKNGNGSVVSISGAKLKPDDITPVILESAVVTAVFGNGFYMEDTDRSAGIKVMWTGDPVSVGDVVSVLGVLDTDNANFERQIIASTVILGKVKRSIEPFLMTNKSVGGSDWSYDSATGAGQKGVIDSAGLNNIGLLVRTNGHVAAVGSDYIIINDGSEALSGSNGIRISCAGLDKPAEGKDVVVTGISTISNVQGNLYRCILVSTQDQISISE